MRHGRLVRLAPLATLLGLLPLSFLMVGFLEAIGGSSFTPLPLAVVIPWAVLSIMLVGLILAGLENGLVLRYFRQYEKELQREAQG